MIPPKKTGGKEEPNIVLAEITAFPIIKFDRVNHWQTLF